MNSPKRYDIAIVGGGLAGLSLAILMAKKNFKVLLLEKKSYPFHKVCGEYISMESWNFLERLGVPLSTMNLPRILHLQVSAPDGTMLNAPLPLGGFGISRYMLDAKLAGIAKEAGVEIVENTTVTDIQFHEDIFTVETKSHTYQARLCCAAHGKRSNLDVKWNRPFTQSPARKLNQYAGIKYHIKTTLPQHLIQLHNFNHGYCGVSAIEEEKYCLCYLTHVSNMQGKNAIEWMQHHVLAKNPFLARLFAESEFLYTEPLAISQVSFSKKSQVENHVLMLGDAAGMITPLCGNGMSMAMHSALIASECIGACLNETISREMMEKKYTARWQQEFGSRLRFGRMIQLFFGRPWVTNLFIRVLKRLPFVTRWLISKTHGKPF